MRGWTLGRSLSEHVVIDLHSHILPGLDDGAPDLVTSVEMARAAVADGVTIMACTPHIKAGVFDNTHDTIADATAHLQRTLNGYGIKLQLVVGADIHIEPQLEDRLTTKLFPTLNRSRYFLFEPPHHVVPPRIEELASRLISAGFVPILTHPERLTWVEGHYDIIERLNELGCLMQLTAGSLTGDFGRVSKAISERMIDEGRVDIIASDAHNTSSRAPGISAGLAVLSRRLGEAEANMAVLGRPLSILKNETLASAYSQRAQPKLGQPPKGLLKRIFSQGRP